MLPSRCSQLPWRKMLVTSGAKAWPSVIEWLVKASGMRAGIMAKE